MAWSPISLQTPSVSRLCLVSTVPQTEPRPRCTQRHRNPFPSGFPKWVSQELCCITSVGVNGGCGVGSDQATIPASCSTVLELSRGWCIPAWHIQEPSLSGHWELTASQRLLTLEIIHCSPGFPSEKQPLVCNRVSSMLGTTLREFKANK